MEVEMEELKSCQVYPKINLLGPSVLQQLCACSAQVVWVNTPLTDYCDASSKEEGRSTWEGDDQESIPRPRPAVRTQIVRESLALHALPPPLSTLVDKSVRSTPR
jgi:hypothetical protein